MNTGKSKKISDKETALGAYIIAFQTLEHELICLFSCLNDKNNPSIGEIISSKLSFDNLLDVLDGIFRYRVKDNDLIDKFSEIMKKAEKFQKERNSHVHSYYDPNLHGSGSYSVLIRNKKIKRGKGYFPIVNTYDPCALEESSHEIYGLAVNIMDFASELQAKGYITDVYDHLA